MDKQIVRGVRHGMYVFMALLVAVLVTGCIFGSDHGSSGNIYLDVFRSAEGTINYCASYSNATYTYDPGQLNGTSGTSSRVVHEKDEHGVELPGRGCHFDDTVKNVRTGQWTITVSFVGHPCTVNIHSGPNIVEIDKNNNCSTHLAP